MFQHKLFTMRKLIVLLQGTKSTDAQKDMGQEAETLEQNGTNKVSDTTAL